MKEIKNGVDGAKVFRRIVTVGRVPSFDALTKRKVTGRRKT